MSVRLPRPLARLGIVLMAVLTALAASLAVAGSASAHVTVSSADATAGGFGKLVFRVPNESDTASTVALRISIPPESALAALSYEAEPGWTTTMTTSDLAEPLDVHGQQVTSYVSVVEFRAAAGGGIGPGQFAEFALSGGPFPEAAELSFPTVQTYSDGSESAWIEPTVEGSAEPEKPAPVLALAGGSTGSTGAAEPAGAPASDGEQTATDTASESTATDDGGSGTATTALVLAVLGLLAGLGGLALGWTARRRTVSS
jgi:periplasmic copper chaperone A